MKGYLGLHGHKGRHGFGHHKHMMKRLYSEGMGHGFKKGCGGSKKCGKDSGTSFCDGLLWRGHKQGSHHHFDDGHGPCAQRSAFYQMCSHEPHVNGPHGHGSHGIGPHGHGPHSHGQHGHGQHGHGPQGHGPQGHGPHSHGPHGHGPHGHGPHGHGLHGHGSQGHGPHGHGPHGHGSQGHGPHGHGPHCHGSQGHGPHGHGPHGHGSQGHGPNGLDSHGHGPHGHGSHGQGPDCHGPHGHGPHVHGPHGRGPQGHGPHGHGHFGHGPDGHMLHCQVHQSNGRHCRRDGSFGSCGDSQGPPADRRHQPAHGCQQQNNELPGHGSQDNGPNGDGPHAREPHCDGTAKESHSDGPQVQGLQATDSPSGGQNSNEPHVPYAHGPYPQFSRAHRFSCCHGPHQRRFQSAEPNEGRAAGEANGNDVPFRCNPHKVKRLSIDQLPTEVRMFLKKKLKEKRCGRKQRGRKSCSCGQSIEGTDQHDVGRVVILEIDDEDENTRQENVPEESQVSGHAERETQCEGSTVDAVDKENRKAQNNEPNE